MTSLEAAQKSARIACIAVASFAGLTVGLIAFGYGSQIVMAAWDWDSPADTLGIVMLAATATPAALSVVALFWLSGVFRAFAEGDFFGVRFSRGLTNACAWAAVATAAQMLIDLLPLDLMAQVAEHRITYDPTKVTLLAFIFCAMFAGRILEVAAALEEENEAIV